MKKERKIKIDLRLVTILLFVPSIIVFFLGWLNIFAGIIASALLIIASAAVLNNKSDSAVINIDTKLLVAVFAVSLIWCWLCGIGGFFYQYYDHAWRNAIFHDLINSEWPVIYSSTNRMLCYYIAAWLIPALFGKLALLAGMSAAAAWNIAGAVMLVYCSLAVCTVFCCIYKLLNTFDKTKIFIVSVVFIFFSGMDFLGILLSGHNPFETLIYEGWTGGLFEFQSMSTGLSWSYNQHEFSWLITAMILIDKKSENLAYWGLLLLPFAPLPFIGIFLMAVLTAVCNLRNGKIKEGLKLILSPQNLLSVFSTGTIFALYYLSNRASSGENSESSYFMITDENSLKNYILFALLEILPFVVLTFRENRKNPMYYLSSAMLILFPLFRIGTSMDFGMKATVPALFYIYILVCKKLMLLYREYNNEKKTLTLITTAVMIAVISIGALTPVNELSRAIALVAETKTIRLQCDEIKTFDNPYLDTNNFTADLDGSIFYEYLSKKH